jgi:hypothetical protein
LPLPEHADWPDSYRAATPIKDVHRSGRHSATITVEVRIVIAVVRSVVPVIAWPTSLDIVEHDAEDSRADGGQQARGMLGGIPTGASMTQHKDDAFNARR